MKFKKILKNQISFRNISLITWQNYGEENVFLMFVRNRLHLKK